ncbi:MAG: DEAD/DEAH box helicase [Gammaproteobacteria bacterium]|nr:DEAD/DEAH box helicase [Gammaproteobacteria bacterium]
MIPSASTSQIGPVEKTIAALQRSERGCITGKLEIPAKPGQYADLPGYLDNALVQALAERGITRLYSHQRQALDVLQRGRNLVVVTPTASGKSLCYNLPVIHAVRMESAKALYLFPTKALSQDQVTELLELNRLGDLGMRVYTYDGDTPSDARIAVRKRGDVVVSNPDMVHQGILPHHTRWARLFESLRYVVIDEAHIYRGCFGAHVANVIRRLRRIAAFYGSTPQFILCSATIGNPAQHAGVLTGQEVVALTESGAPQGPRDVLFWNPPVVNPELGLRASARSQSARISRQAVSNGARSIVFARSRTMVEVLTKYLKDAFDTDQRKPARVRAYRGGHLPAERRKTERSLRAGEVDCVVTTSALELGVDIGALDVCILNGYPGTIAATWQRLGRVGRRQRRALGVLVASSDPLDQFVVRHPEFFVNAPPEQARVAPDQDLIVLDHIRCAAFELPFKRGELFGPVAPDDYLAYLQEEEVLHLEGDRWHWMAESYPANTVNLRSVANGNFIVIDVTDGQRNVIAEVDYAGAAKTLYEGAIYLIQAAPWQVEKLDWEGRKAFVRKTRAGYYTEAIDYTRLKILERFDTDAGARTECAHGEVHVVCRVKGYKKIRYYTHETIGYGEIDLPDCEMHSTALWWRLAPSVLSGLFPEQNVALDGLQGAAYALHHVAALLSMAELADLGRCIGTGQEQWPAHDNAPESRQRFEPALFLYDNFPGGMGLSTPLYEQRTELVARAQELVSACECPIGCPACVGPVLQSDEHRYVSLKQAALGVLSVLGKTQGIERSVDKASVDKALENRAPDGRAGALQ